MAKIRNQMTLLTGKNLGRLRNAKTGVWPLATGAVQMPEFQP